MVYPLPPAPTAESAGGAGTLSLDVRFACVRTGGTTMLRLAVAHEGGGAAIIQCDDMALAGQVLTDLSTFLSITSLESLIDFPQSLTAFGSTLTRLQELSTLRSRLSGDLAESTGGVKVLVLRAEDARVRGDMRGVQACVGGVGGHSTCTDRCIVDITTYGSWLSHTLSTCTVSHTPHTHSPTHAPSPGTMRSSGASWQSW